MRRGGAALALVAGMLALGAGSAQASPFHGVVTQGALTAADFEQMGTGNAGTLRVSVRWTAIQPALGTEPATWNWAGLDSIVGGAAENGVRVLASLDGPSPPGAADPPVSPSARRAFAEFAGAVADRYGRGGYFWETATSVLPITTYQAYNEQNGPAYWGARPSPGKYAKLLKATSKQIGSQDGRAEIVLGGMFGTPSGRGAIDSWKFLNKLYGVRGVKRLFDTVAIHPYAENLRGIEIQAEKIRRVMRANGDRRAKLRITEFGWGSANHGHLNLGRKGQARMLKKAFGLFEDRKRAWKIKGANWFSFQDDPSGACSFCRTSGLFEADRDPKPSWRAFKRVARR